MGTTYYLFLDENKHHTISTVLIWIYWVDIARLKSGLSRYLLISLLTTLKEANIERKQDQEGFKTFNKDFIQFVGKHTSK